VKLLRNERLSAVLLVLAAAAGLLLANLRATSGLVDLSAVHLPVPWLGLDLSVRHWVTDGLLAIFFFLAAIELKHELTGGELSSARRALVPAVAAVGGVIVPAALFLLLVRDPALADGWPIPTATDVAFALGALAILGRGLPTRIRAFLLALAVIDDLIAILVIAAFFTSELSPLPLLCAVPVILLFGWLSRGTGSPWRTAAMVVLALGAWILVALSGIHPTIAGVALGLVMAGGGAARARHALEPFSNLLVLPLFAFVAALVVIPDASGGLSPVFWAIVVALPVGKLVGITGAGMIASRLAGRREERMPAGDLVVVAGLGGIGFTVSLLMNELAYGGSEIAAEGTVAVLIGSATALVVGGAITAVRSAQYRRGRAVSRSRS